MSSPLLTQAVRRDLAMAIRDLMQHGLMEVCTSIVCFLWVYYLSCLSDEQLLPLGYSIVQGDFHQPAHSCGEGAVKKKRIKINLHCGNALVGWFAVFPQRGIEIEIVSSVLTFIFCHLIGMKMNQESGRSLIQIYSYAYLY